MAPGMSRLWCALLVALTLAASAQEPARPRVGAIRWDGWTSEGPVAAAVAKSLTPPEWRYRLPFFATIGANGVPSVAGDRPEVMSAEIAAARAAGLDYWAFLAYNEKDVMSQGLDLYLADPSRADVGFCMISETARWRRQNVEAMAERFARLMSEPGYVKVGDGRPLFYLLHHDTSGVDEHWGGPAGFREAMDALRAAAARRGLPVPYLAVMTGDLNVARDLLKGAGLDALSAYAFQRADVRGRYSTLAGDVERFWEIQRGYRLPVIPLAMAGWDRRPRVQNPVPWEHFGGMMDKYYETARPEQLAAHVQNAVRWVQANPETCPARAVIVYAWNEFDEGGWLCPTLVEGDARVQALGRVLRAGGFAPDPARR